MFNKYFLSKLSTQYSLVSSSFKAAIILFIASSSSLDGAAITGFTGDLALVGIGIGTNLIGDLALVGIGIGTNLIGDLAFTGVGLTLVAGADVLMVVEIILTALGCLDGLGAVASLFKGHVDLLVPSEPHKLHLTPPTCWY